MRSKTEMIARVRRHIADTDENEWTDAEISSRLEDAAEALWDDLLEHPDGKRVLRKYGDYTALVAETEEYDLPADLGLLDYVEVRWLDADTRGRKLQRRRPPQGEKRNGTGELFGVEGAGSSTGFLFWYDDVDEGQIRIWPYLSTVNEEKYRFCYYHYPTYPTDDAGTFNDPTNSGTDTDTLPERVDEAVEYYAAAMLGTEEVENGRFVGNFGRLYAATLASLVRVRAAGRLKPKRRYIGDAR